MLFVRATTVALLAASVAAYSYADEQELQSLPGSHMVLRNLAQLEKIDCADTVIDLGVSWETLDIPGIVEFHTRLYTMKTSDAPDGEPIFPAPPIVMHPGTRCQIRVINSLPTGQDAACPTHGNTYHCPDTTTLHTHGLHVSSEQDQINSHVNPGETVVYVYDIPPNHMEGTHWFHAHHHGSTSLQVFGGMAGSLLVARGAQATVPADLAAYYDDEENSYLMTLTFLDFETYVDLSSNLFDEETIVPNPAVFDSTATVNYLVNGHLAPTIRLVDGVPKLLRIIHAVGDAWAYLAPTAGNCDVTLVARDGVFLPSFPSTDGFAMVAGTRTDVLVTCHLSDPATAELGAFGATDTVTTSISDANRHVQNVIFNMDIVPNTSGADSPLSLATPPASLFPDYLTTTGMTVSTSVPTGGTLTNTIAFALGGDVGTVNGEVFPGIDHGEYVGDMCTNQLYELNLGVAAGGGGGPGDGGPGDGDGGPGAPRRQLQGAVTHPYHQHVNHFQVTTRPAADTDAVAMVGEWRDVIPTSGYVVQFITADFPGEIVMHCHILLHEDIGMMALWNVDACGTDAPAVAASGGFEVAPLSYQCSTGGGRDGTIVDTCTDGGGTTDSSDGGSTTGSSGGGSSGSSDSGSSDSGSSDSGSSDSGSSGSGGDDYDECAQLSYSSSPLMFLDGKIVSESHPCMTSGSCDDIMTMMMDGKSLFVWGTPAELNMRAPPGYCPTE